MVVKAALGEAIPSVSIVPSPAVYFKAVFMVPLKGSTGGGGAMPLAAGLAGTAASS